MRATRRTIFLPTQSFPLSAQAPFRERCHNQLKATAEMWLRWLPLEPHKILISFPSSALPKTLSAPDASKWHSQLLPASSFACADLPFHRCLALTHVTLSFKVLVSASSMEKLSTLVEQFSSSHNVFKSLLPSVFLGFLRPCDARGVRLHGALRRLSSLYFALGSISPYTSAPNLVSS